MQREKLNKVKRIKVEGYNFKQVVNDVGLIEKKLFEYLRG